MSLFSERISDYIAISGMSLYQLGKRGKIDRSTIHKVKLGERLPSLDFYEHLCEALTLNPYEQKELDELYEMAKIGDQIFFRRKKVKEVIEELSGNTNKIGNEYCLEENRTIEPFLGGMKVIRGKNQVNNAIINILNEDFFQNEQPQIVLSVSFEHRFLYEFLYNAFVSSSKTIEIDHFICIEKNSQSTKGCLNNLERLKYILSFSLSGKKGYRPYYYYNENDPAKNINDLFPYYILTGRYVLALSGDLKDAVIYDDIEMIELYRNRVEWTKRKLPLLVQWTDSVLDMFNWNNEELPDAVIEPSPCLARQYTPEIIETLIKEDIPEREMIVQAAKDYYGPLQRGEVQQARTIFSINGLQELMETGRFYVGPVNIVNNISSEYRQVMLTGIKKDILEKKSEYIVINPDRFKIPMNIEIMKLSSPRIMFSCLNETHTEMVTIFLKEISIYEAFEDFFDYLPGSDLVLSEETLLKVIDQYLE
ncbi:MAG: helix-turn-helix transcriptional regulator [Eubacterium sp.]